MSVYKSTAVHTIISDSAPVLAVASSTPMVAPVLGATATATSVSMPSLSSFIPDDAMRFVESPFIPPLVSTCIAILEERGLEVEGILRVSGSQLLIKEYAANFAKGMRIASDTTPSDKQ
jgi:hypothetical protein